MSLAALAHHASLLTLNPTAVLHSPRRRTLSRSVSRSRSPVRRDDSRSRCALQPGHLLHPVGRVVWTARMTAIRNIALCPVCMSSQLVLQAVCCTNLFSTQPASMVSKPALKTCSRLLPAEYASVVTYCVSPCRSRSPVKSVKSVSPARDSPEKMDADKDVADDREKSASPAKSDD